MLEQSCLHYEDFLWHFLPLKWIFGHRLFEQYSNRRCAFQKVLPYSCDKFLSFISSSLLYDGIWEEDIVTNVLKTLKLYQVKLVLCFCHIICKLR